MNEHTPAFRRDIVTGRTVLITPGRRGSPRDFGAVPVVRDARECPFCEGREASTAPTRSERRDAENRWITRAFANLFPLVREEASGPRAAVGEHEVVVETPLHDVDLAALSDAHACAVFDLYFERFAHMAARSDARAIMLFKNRGPRAGASLAHAHGQVLSLPIVPVGVRCRDLRAARHYARRGVGTVAAALARELADGTRVIEHDEHFAVFCPYAPQASYETWIVPRFESAQPGSLARVERDALAVLVTRTLRRMLRVNENADYNLVLRVAARTHWAAPWARWHLELIPRRGGDAGFELTSEMRCVLVPPEESARVLRASHE